MKEGSFARIWPTAGGAVAVLIGLSAINDDVRSYVAGVLTGTRSSELVWYVEDTARFVIQSVRDQSFEYGPLMVFGVVAAVLLLFMLRT